ncbi:MAG: fused MFS/spermidine synthase, partial [Chloroflexota bacterium]
MTNSNLDLAGDCRDNDCRTTHGNASARSMVSGPTWLLSALVFCGGIASIGAELATSRLIAPYFGSSTFIWSTLIGLTMAFLALGYWLGGRVADRHPDAFLLYFLAAIAGLAVTLIPVAAKPILQVSLDAFANLDLGAFYGSLIG